MHNASWKGHADIVKMLLDKGADPSIVNNEGQTAYTLASNADVGALLQNLQACKYFFLYIYIYILI